MAQTVVWWLLLLHYVSWVFMLQAFAANSACILALCTYLVVTYLPCCVAQEWDTYFSQNRLPHESYFIRLFAALRLQNITTHGCFYLNDDVNDLTNAERAADVVSSVVAFNAQHPDSAITGRLELQLAYY